MSENGKRNIAKETKEQAMERGRRLLISRNRNGIWIPPMLGKKADKCPNWLGEKAGYNGKHRWVQKNWHKNGKCEECGAMPVSKGRNKFATQWSNNDHNYRRIREEWQELCTKCHKKKDKEIIN